MASDIPDTGFSSGLAMARVLVTYMDCPHRVRRAIRMEFRHPPAIRTIEKMRERHLAPAPEPERIHFHEAYDPFADAKGADEINKRFLWRLDQERLASTRRREVV